MITNENCPQNGKKECEMDMIKERMANLLHDNDEKTKNFIQLQTIINDSKKTVNHWQKQIESITDELEKSRETIKQKNIQIAYLTEQRRLLVESKKPRVNTSTNFNISNGENERQIESLSRELNESNKFIAQLKEANNNYEKEKANLQTCSKNMSIEISQLKEKMLQQEADLRAALSKTIKENTSKAKTEQVKLLEGNDALLRENLKLEDLSQKELELQELHSTKSGGDPQILQLELKVKQETAIAKELVKLPELSTIYETKLKGKEPMTQIACAIDFLIKATKAYKKI